jgi:hypothetical protein
MGFKTNKKISLHVYRAFVARLRLGKNTPTIARQQLNENVTAATNKYATLEELRSIDL